MTAMQLLELATQAITSSSDAYELCRNFVHSDIGSLSTTGSQIIAVDQKGDLREIASYGNNQSLGDKVSLWDEHEIAKAIASKEFASFQLGSSEVSVFPFYKDLAPVGALVLTTSRPWTEDLLDDASQRIIAKLGAFYLDTNGLNIRQPAQSNMGNPNDLTARQIEVLGLMSLGQTNAEISRAMMLSESTIRQETVRIYRSLGVSSRSEASKKAKALGLIGRTGPSRQGSGSSSQFE